MATPQELLENLKKSSKEVEVRSDKIFTKIEENKNAIEEFYNKKIEELNNMTPPFVDEGGNNVVFEASKVSGDKAEYLKMYYAEYDANKPIDNKNSQKDAPKLKSQTQKFQESLKNEVQKVEKSNKSLKKMAESTLKYKTTLIEKNKDIIGTLKSELSSAELIKINIQENINELDEKIKEVKLSMDDLADKYDELVKQSDKFKEEKKDLESKRNDLINSIKAKNDELQKAQSDNKSKDEIDSLQAEFDRLNDEYSNTNTRINEITNTLLPDIDNKMAENGKITNDKTNELNILESTKTSKESELSSIPDEAEYLTVISEMEQINNNLEASLDKNIEDYIDKFDEVDIDFTVPSEEEILEENSKVEESKDSKNSKEQNAKESPTISATASVPENNQENLSNSMIPANDSKFKVDTFINSSFDEQKRMLNYYGYAQLADSVSKIGPFQRKKLTNILERHLEESIPSKVEFRNVIDSFAGSLGINCDELYSSLVDENNNVTPFNKVDVSKLKDLNRIISHFNQNRANFIEEDIKAFEVKFIQFVKTGTLLQKAKTGRIASLFSGMTKKSSELSGILNGMSAYTWKNAERISESNAKNSNIRSSLGAAVNTNLVETTRLDRKSRSIEEQHR